MKTKHLSMFASLVLAIGMSVCMIFFCPAKSSATYFEIGLSEYNRSLNDMTNGSYYGSGGTYTYNGIPLSIADGTGGNNNIWNGVNDSDHRMDIDVSIFQADSVYTLINSFWGYEDNRIGFLEFYGTGGAYFKYDLIEGLNVRDHYNNYFVNYTDDPMTVDNVISPGGDVRLDMQIIKLPDVFSNEFLTRISVTSLDLGYSGVPFVAAVTVNSNITPEPATMLLLGVGIIGLAGLRKKSCNRIV